MLHGQLQEIARSTMRNVAVGGKGWVGKIAPVSQNAISRGRAYTYIYIIIHCTRAPYDRVLRRCEVYTRFIPYSCGREMTQKRVRYTAAYYERLP